MENNGLLEENVPHNGFPFWGQEASFFFYLEQDTEGFIYMNIRTQTRTKIERKMSPKEKKEKKVEQQKTKQNKSYNKLSHPKTDQRK